jgi:hypothetical protein
MLIFHGLSENDEENDHVPQGSRSDFEEILSCFSRRSLEDSYFFPLSLATTNKVCFILRIEGWKAVRFTILCKAEDRYT